MRYYDTPVLIGTTEEKVKQIEQFLFRHVNDLNYNLENTTAERFWQQTAEALTASSEKVTSKKEEQLRRDEYDALRALVIKSATAVLKTEDTFSQTLQGAYLAESEHGTFMEEGFLNISGSPYSISQLYKYQTTLLSGYRKELDDQQTVLDSQKTEIKGISEYKTELEGYIKTGVLEKGTSSPVFGMDIGYNKNTFTYNGTEYTNSEPSKIRITPSKISFYEGNYEVAYIEKKAVYFPVAHIKGGTLEIGDNFSVDKNGNMKATNADITGAVKASEGYIGGFAITGSSGKIFWPCSLASVINPTDDTKKQYVVFLRGNYSQDGTDFGALTTDHNVFGIKKRAVSTASWENDESPYVFRVSLKGDICANQIDCESITLTKIDCTGKITCSDDISAKNLIADSGYINTKWLKANENRVALGTTEDGQEFSNNIELITSGEILIGKYAGKAKNIYILASSNIRIGQHTSTSAASGAENYPSTSVIKIEAATSITLGTNTSYKPTNTYVYSENIWAYGPLKPGEDEAYDLGISGKKWRYFSSRYMSAESGNIVIGTRGEDTYTKDIYIRTSGKIYLNGGTVYVNGKAI